MTRNCTLYQGVKDEFRPSFLLLGQVHHTLMNANPINTWHLDAQT